MLLDIKNSKFKIFIRTSTETVIKIQSCCFDVSVERRSDVSFRYGVVFHAQRLKTGCNQTRQNYSPHRRNKGDSRCRKSGFVFLCC